MPAIETLGQLEAMIVRLASGLFDQRLQPGSAGTAYKFASKERYESVQGALQRGTYVDNLWNAWASLADGAELQIRGCRIGQNLGWLGAFRHFFSPGSSWRPHVSAPKLWDAFGARTIRRGRET